MPRRPVPSSRSAAPRRPVPSSSATLRSAATDRAGVPPGPYVVAGIGLAGRSAAAALAAREQDVAAWDGLQRPAELRTARRLRRRGIRVVGGGDGLELLDGARTLVKSPGLPPSTPLVAEARARGLEVIDEAELGWRLDTRPLVAITGTNGKGTTTALADSVLRAAGMAPVVAGNTLFGVPLTEAAGAAGDVVLAELSSFQLEGCTQLRPQAAVLTNLTTDHVYRHGTLAAYGATKRTLFLRDGTASGVAAIGVDQPFGRALADEVTALGGTVMRHGRHRSADRRVLDASWALDTARITVSEGRGRRVLETQLVGAHNAANVVAALALSDVLGLDPDTSAAAIAATAPLPGRFELIRGGAVDVVVDYAHNADGVRRVLDTARAIVTERRRGALRVVVSVLALAGARTARAIGRVARLRADHLVLTTQRWHTHEPGGVLPRGLREGAESVAGAKLRVQCDRGLAIDQAIAAARPGDLVLILNRGEQGGGLYDPAGNLEPFDDRVRARAALGIV